MSDLSRHARAYGGWFSGLMGGLIIGLGIMFLMIIPMAMKANEAWTDEMNYVLDKWRSLHPDDDVPPARVPSEAQYAYANAQTYGVVFVFMGALFGAAGVYEIRASLKTAPPQPSVAASTGKKYCGYCGAENKSDAVFCGKCGKKITEPSRSKFRLKQ